MNKYSTDIRFTVTANSGAWGVATLEVNLPKYNGDPEAFQRDLMQQVLCMGYTSILHYNDNLGLLMCCYTTHKLLFEKILSHIKSLRFYAIAAEAIKDIKGTDDEFKQYEAWNWAKKNGVDLQFNEHTGKWTVPCTLDEDNVVDKIWDHRGWLRNCKEVLELTGFDPEQRERIHRQCENMGMYRV